MRERSLGDHSIRLTELTLGTWGLAAGAYGASEAGALKACVEAALDQGVRAFDMAPCWGESESQVASVAWTRRAQLRYITRGGVERGEGGALRWKSQTAELKADCEASLRRLRSDRIDLWLYHSPPESLLRQSEWQQAMVELREAGKLRAWGVSVTNLSTARLAIAAGAQALCLPYSLLQPELLHELGADLSASGCGVLVRSPLCHGLLAGRWASPPDFAPTDHRSRRWLPATLASRLRQVDRCRFLLRPPVSSLAEAALRFVLANGLVSSVAIGPTSPAQLRELSRAATAPPYLPEDDLGRVAELI